MSVGSLCIAPAGMNTLYAQQNQLFHQSNLLKNDAASLLIGNQIAESIEGSVKEIPCENGEYKLTYGDSLKIHTTDSYFYEGENPEGITITNEKNGENYTTIITANQAGASVEFTYGDTTIKITTEKRQLTATASVLDKIYDGTVDAEYGQIPTVSNVLTQDAADFSYTYSKAAFDTKDYGTKKEIQPIKITSNNSNYEIEDITGLTATINKKQNL